MTHGSDAALRLVPLGGLGEIGMNCLALEQGDDVVIIDCGVTFPTTDLGIDLYHPRFDYLLERADRVRGVVITHGHEDHIGALPYLLGSLDVPVYGPRHALSLARLRLEEHDDLADDVRFVETRVGETFSLGSFTFEPIRVTHSITEATALAIGTCAGTVVHTGDFKLDAAPADGELTDEARLRELGDAGVRLLLSDSTNVDSPGTSTSEEVVGAELDRVVGDAPARVIVGLFASNVQRLIHLGRVARKTGRKVCLLGRSMQTHVRVARDIGRLSWPSDLVVSPDVAAGLPPREVLVLATGTQAEPLAAMARLANGTHPKLRLDPGDRVVFSSRVIPGNDRAVYDLYAGFLRAGIEVRTRVGDPHVHASGHAHREELRRMLELVRPRAFVPVHGTRHHLERHAALAREVGVADVLVIENGEVATVGEDAALAKHGKVTVGRVATHDLAPLPDEVLHQRAQIGRAGVLSVSLTLDRSGRVVAGPEVRSVGVLGPLEADVARGAEKAARAAAERMAKEGASPDVLEEAVRLAARRSVEAETGCRAVVLTSVLRT